MATSSDLTFSALKTDSTIDTDLNVPTKILEKGLLSKTSEAYDCFAYQKFSSKLQMFLINYNIIVSSLYPIYK
jgi:hypothetical protein